MQGSGTLSEWTMLTTLAYDQIADWYALERSLWVGIPELEALISRLPPRPDVLDLGCGNGIPLTRHLLQAGAQVWAIDGSAAMLKQFRQNCPEVPVQHAAIEHSDWFGRHYDAIVSWGVWFYLPDTLQHQLIRQAASQLRAAGWLWFTAGREAGERHGHMNGVDFHYWSLGEAGYREALQSQGFGAIEVIEDAGANCYYYAQRVAEMAG